MLLRRRTPTIAAGALAATLAIAVPAAAAPVHTVAPGETLWSIAAADGLDPAALAAANGLSPDVHVIAGSTLAIPAQGPETAAVAPAPATSADAASGVASVATSATTPVGAESGTSTPPAASATTGSVSAGDIAATASANGVSGSLAQAVAYQESGFQSDIVSPTGARGAMQVEPGTFDYVQRNLAGGSLDDTPLGNVTAGTLYLRHLLDASGGDAATALAGYYQGPGSVASVGVLPETQHYVANVLALQQRFENGG